jgi:hypothetical protein
MLSGLNENKGSNEEEEY